MNELFVRREQCDVCGSSHKTILTSRDLVSPALWNFLEAYYGHRIEHALLDGARYEIARCPDCGLMWQTEILNERGMGLLYGQWIAAEGSQQRKTAASRTLYADYARDIYALGTLLPGRPHETTLLDYGMGWGRWCLMAKAFGYQVYGSELSAERIAYAQSNAIPVIQLADMPPEQFDFINSDQVFEHLPDPAATLRQLVNGLKPGGIIKITVPNAAPEARRLADPAWIPAKNAFHPLEHINSFTRKSLVRLAEQAGLQPIRPPQYVVLGGYSVKTLLKALAARFGVTPPTRLYAVKPKG